MKYTVRWVPIAEQELAAIWLASADREAVTRAAHRLDQRLRTTPFSLGESRQSSLSRIAFEPPLAIEFEVIEDDKKVRVLAVSSAV
jgi:plasmid stabilization system protein ParE